MSLSQKIAAEVDDLVASKAPPLCITAEDGPYRLDLVVGLATEVGIESDGFDFTVSGRPERSMDDLKAWGERLSGRLTYLMEPLSVLEADPEAGKVLLRSKSPTPRGGRANYFEVLLERSGRMRLDRVSFDEATRRRLRSASFQLTREVLERLVDDLVACA